MNQHLEFSDLSLVLIRLLAIALEVTTQSTATTPGNLMPPAMGYRSWPTRQIVGLGRDHREMLKLYMCSKGTRTSDDETFAVGTRFVVETFRTKDVFSLSGRGNRRVQGELVRVFVMQKYASLEQAYPNCHTVAGWVSRTYARDETMGSGCERNCQGHFVAWL